MIHHFFAYIARLRYIRRWGLMRSSMSENDAEHSLQVAMLAHGMALIGKNRYGRDCNPEHIVTLAVYHDASEVITGDMPTPVKYHSLELRGAYKDVEKMANDRLLAICRRIYAPVSRRTCARGTTMTTKSSRRRIRSARTSSAWKSGARAITSSTRRARRFAVS